MSARRKFIQNSLLVGLGTNTLLHSTALKAAVEKVDAERIKEWPKMTYRTLGRTRFEASCLVYGCGAALMRSKKDALLNIALEAGINVFDVGTSRYYANAEKNLSGFLKSCRDDIFLISKSFLNASEKESPNVERSKQIAKDWHNDLDLSLENLDQEHVDAYYIMAANNPALIKNEEIYKEFEKAKEAGKVSYLGLSTHQNAQDVLEAASETDWYHLAMVAITPAGWYDFNRKAILKDSPPMVELKPVFDKAKKAGVALVGMKAARHLAPRMFGGRNAQNLYDSMYNDQLKNSNFSAYQKSYAFVLEHGMDVVNSDIQNIDVLAENYAAAAISATFYS